MIFFPYDINAVGEGVPKVQGIKISNQVRNAFKRKAVDRERNNYNYINLIPCSGKGGWHEIPDHSALIMYYVVQKDKQKPTSFNDDFAAPYVKYDIGYILTPSPEKVIQEIKDAGLYESHTLIDTDGEETDSAIHGYSIKLNREFTGEEIEEFKEREEKRRIANLTVRHPDALNPGLHLAIVEVARRVIYFYNRYTPDIARRTAGEEATKNCYAILKQYRMMLIANDRMETNSQEYLEYILKRLETIRRLIIVTTINLSSSADINKKFAVDSTKSIQALAMADERAERMLVSYQERLESLKRKAEKRKYKESQVEGQSGSQQQEKLNNLEEQNEKEEKQNQPGAEGAENQRDRVASHEYEKERTKKLATRRASKRVHGSQKGEARNIQRTLF